MAVVVGVTTYRSVAALPEFLSCLPAGMAGVDSWRLVVVDSGSDDGTVDLVRRMAPSATVIALDRNQGFAAGVNIIAGVDPAAEAVLVLSPSVRLGPGCVRPLLDAVAEPGLGIAVPRLRDGAGELKFSLRRRPTVLRMWGEAVLGGRRACRFPALSEIVGSPSRYYQRTVADWSTGAAMLLGGPCVRAVGRWDESFFLYSEETDFALRAADAGFHLVLVPEAEAVHLGGQSHVVPELWARCVTNKVRLFARRNGRGRAWAFWSAGVLGEALRSVSPGGRAHRAALGALVRLRRQVLRGEPFDSAAGSPM